MTSQGVGRPVRRKEDARLLAGRGRFSDDVNLPGQAYACIVRSPHAHARIVRIDAAAALRVAGVLAVLTGADATADGLAPIPHRPIPTNPHEFPLAGREASPVFVAPHRVLATDRARFVDVERSRKRPRFTGAIAHSAPGPGADAAATEPSAFAVSRWPRRS